MILLCFHNIISTPLQRLQSFNVTKTFYEHFVAVEIRLNGRYVEYHVFAISWFYVTLVQRYITGGEVFVDIE